MAASIPTDIWHNAGDAISDGIQNSIRTFDRPLFWNCRRALKRFRMIFKMIMEIGHFGQGGGPQNDLAA
jgi:hypothetical protein